MIIRSSLILALALPLVAQDKGDSIKAGSVASFYKAYFLDKEGSKNKKSTAKAIDLYTAFLAQNTSHKLAGRAAANCVVLMYANGDIKKADAFATKHDKLMANVETGEAGGAGGIMSMFGRRGGGQQEDNPNQEQVDKLMALHESAEGAKKDRLGSAITRLGGGRDLMMARFRGGGAGGFGGRGGDRGGRGGFGGRGGSRGFTKPNIAEMKQEDAVKAVETMVSSLERQIDSMAQRGQADQADALEEKVDKIQDLVDEGKLKEAQKLIDSIEVGSSSRRGGSNQGRRRRGGDGGDGGDAGGDGNRRRRRGGDTGDAGGSGTGSNDTRRRRR